MIYKVLLIIMISIDVLSILGTQLFIKYSLQESDISTAMLEINRV